MKASTFIEELFLNLISFERRTERAKKELFQSPHYPQVDFLASISAYLLYPRPHAFFTSLLELPNKLLDHFITTQRGKAQTVSMASGKHAPCEGLRRTPRKRAQRFTRRAWPRADWTELGEAEIYSRGSAGPGGVWRMPTVEGTKDQRPEDAPPNPNP